ncbi:MAG TPA: LysR family transcriptional regulator, partial [Thiobacillus sp.]|nr:LysR family transcriptional regulator [Thiobacillus sp.]
MDTELARTFLTVAATGNFVAAASRLHVTQSTVSARIHTLENALGARLFQRGRNGAELTPSGKRFMRHAKHLVRTVEQALHDVGLPQGFH